MFKFNFKLNYFKIINILPTTLEYNSADVYTSSTYLLLSADFFLLTSLYTNLICST